MSIPRSTPPRRKPRTRMWKVRPKQWSIWATCVSRWKTVKTRQLMNFCALFSASNYWTSAASNQTTLTIRFRHRSAPRSKILRIATLLANSNCRRVQRADSKRHSRNDCRRRRKDWLLSSRRKTFTRAICLSWLMLMRARRRRTKLWWSSLRGETHLNLQIN